ncbi:MAG: hypothetical protein ABJQ29_10285 [Luteolibacter sp.]
MKSYLPFTAAILIALQPAFAETGTELLDKLIAAPGSYSQVCDVLMTTPDVPFKAFQIQDYAGAYFSDDNLSLIRSQREGLVAAVRKRLREIDLTREPVAPKPDPNAEKEELEMGDCYGADPKSLNSFLFEIIKRTSATEALPELLALEERLVVAINEAKEGGDPPEVSGWYAGIMGQEYDEHEPETVSERRSKLNRSRIAQRDLVMLIAMLMREQKYGPYLATDFEKAYVEGLRKQAEENGIAKDDPYIQTDPISGIRHYKYVEVAIPYSRPLRDGVRAAAEKWISEH